MDQVEMKCACTFPFEYYFHKISSLHYLIPISVSKNTHMYLSASTIKDSCTLNLY